MKSAARAPRGTGLKLNQVCEKPCRASARSSCTFRRFDRNSRAEPAERQARMVGCRNSCASVQSPHLAVGRPAKMPHYGPQSRRGSAAREGRTKRGADCGGARPGVGSAPASSSRAETYDPVILPNGERMGLAAMRSRREGSMRGPAPENSRNRKRDTEALSRH